VVSYCFRTLQVHARPGQRLNLTVHGAGARSSLCAGGLVIDVVDGDLTATLRPPCGGTEDRRRQRLTYTSVGSEIEVYVRSTGVATVADDDVPAAPATAASSDDDDDDGDDLSAATSSGFLLHYQGASRSVGRRLLFLLYLRRWRHAVFHLSVRVCVRAHVRAWSAELLSDRIAVDFELIFNFYYIYFKNILARIASTVSSARWSQLLQMLQGSVVCLFSHDHEPPKRMNRSR